LIALYIVGGLLILLFLIAMLSLTAEASFAEGSFAWSIRLCGVRILPRDKKEKKPEEQDKPKTPKRKRSFDEIRLYAELFLRLLKRFFKRMKIEHLRIHFLSAFDDPYDTAMAYSYAGLAMETLAGIANGRIRKLELHTDLDFDSEELKLDLYFLASIRLISLLCLLRAFKKGRADIQNQLTAKEKEHVESTDR